MRLTYGFCVYFEQTPDTYVSGIQQTYSPFQPDAYDNFCTSVTSWPSHCINLTFWQTIRLEDYPINKHIEVVK